MALGELFEQMYFVKGNQLSDWYDAVRGDPALPVGVRLGRETDRRILDDWAAAMARRHRRPGSLQGDVTSQVRLMFQHGGNRSGFLGALLKNVEDRIIVYEGVSDFFLVDHALAMLPDAPFRLAKIRVIADPDDPRGARTLEIVYPGAPPAPSATPDTTPLATPLHVFSIEGLPAAAAGWLSAMPAWGWGAAGLPAASDSLTATMLTAFVMASMFFWILSSTRP